MGARRPFFVDGGVFDGGHGAAPEGEGAPARDRTHGRVGPARGRGAHARADGEGAVLRLRRPSAGRRPRALRAGDGRAAVVPRPLHGRRLVAGVRTAAPDPRALRARRRQERPCEDADAEGARRGRRRGRPVGPHPDRQRCSRHTVRRDRAGQPDRRREELGMSQEIVDAVREIEREKGIESGTLVAALEDALLAAYKKTPGASRHATVELDERGDFRVYSIEIPPDLEERLLDEARERTLDELERVEEETGEKNHTLLSDDDLELDWSEVPDELIKREDVTPENFGRIAAQTAKQVILQRIREAEREMMYDEYIDRVGEVVTGIVQQTGDRRNILVDLGKVEALLPGPEQVDGERYEQGSRIKAVIRDVRTGTKGPQVILSRRDPELIKTLFELEVPEIADGLVEIRGVAREPGYRSKIVVESHAQGVDPVGACVGPRGSRVRMVVSELRGEKIDIIPWNPEPARFVAKALSPARVREVYLDDEAREATVVVPDDQLALAIGKEGMNARLAARLTGWKVDIQSDTEFAQAEAEAAFGGGEEGAEDFSGRCAAILANGKRCPNAALPGSRFCGVPAHQALEGTGSDYVAGPPAEAEEAEGAEAAAEEPETHDELADAAGVTPEAAEELPDSTPPVTEPAGAGGDEPPVAPEAEVAEPEAVPAGIPVEQPEGQ